MPKIELMQGDCLDKMKDIPDGSIDAVMTDPPYGTTACKWDSVIPFDEMWEQLKRITKKNGAIVLFGSQPFTSALVMSNVKMFKYCWVWEKTRKTGFPNSQRQPLRNIEDIVVFYKNQATYNPQGVTRIDKNVTRNKPKNDTVNAGENDGSLCRNYVQEFTGYPNQIVKVKSEGNTTHPTQKPVALMEYLIKTYTNEGETVLDFAMGSGTTGVACKNLNRNFIGIELDPEYFKIAEKRINDKVKELKDEKRKNV